RSSDGDTALYVAGAGAGREGGCADRHFQFGSDALRDAHRARALYRRDGKRLSGRDPEGGSARTDGDEQQSHAAARTRGAAVSGEKAGAALPFGARPRLCARSLVCLIRRTAGSDGCGPVAFIRPGAASLDFGGDVATWDVGIRVGVLHTP